MAGLLHELDVQHRQRAEGGVERCPFERTVGVEAQPRGRKALAHAGRERQLGGHVATQLELEGVGALFEACLRVAQLERRDPCRHRHPRGHGRVALRELEAVPQDGPQRHPAPAGVGVEQGALEAEARGIGLSREVLAVARHGAREVFERAGLHAERRAQRSQRRLRELAGVARVAGQRRRLAEPPHPLEHDTHEPPAALSEADHRVLDGLIEPTDERRERQPELHVVTAIPTANNKPYTRSSLAVPVSASLSAAPSRTQTARNNVAAKGEVAKTTNTSEPTNPV